MAKAKKKTTKPIKKVSLKAKAKPAKKAAAKTKPKKLGKAHAKKITKKAAAPKKTSAIKKTAAPKTAAKAMAVKPTTKSKPISKIDYSKVVTPLGDRIVVRLALVEKVTAGGLIIPETVNTVAGHLKGEVLAVGHGAKNKKGQLRPLDVQKGDHVLFSAHAGSKVQFGTEDLHIVHESDVLGIVQK